MKEQGFCIADQQEHFIITGGKLWQAPTLEDKWVAQLDEKKLTISFRPEDTLEEVFNSFRKLIKDLSPVLSLRLFASTLLTPLVLILPAIILIVFIGTVGAYGNLINELVSAPGGGNETTHLGISKYQLFFIQTAIYIIGAYAFPLFFQGDYDDTVTRFKGLTDNQEIMKSRLRNAMVLLQKRNYLDRVILWNPNLVSPENKWIIEILLPAIVKSKAPLSLMVKVEEQFVSRSLLEELSGKKLAWHKKENTATLETQAINSAYLESWEKEMWQVFSAASTQNLPEPWRNTHVPDIKGSLTGVVSIPLARNIVSHFRNRLFSSTLEEYEASVSLFASRCINDYGLLRSLGAQELNMFSAQPAGLQAELGKLKEERSYILPYLIRQAGEIAGDQKDIASLVILGGTQADQSVYNQNKRLIIEAFISLAANNEKFSVLRHYWDQMIGEAGQDQQAAEVELFRLLDTETLRELVLAFRRAGMYEKTDLCYRFLHAIYPIDSSIGEAVVLSEQGKYHEAVEKFLETEAEWMGDLFGESPHQGSADIHARMSLNLFMCVVIVMNRLEDHKSLAERSLALIGRLLLQMNDGERNNQQLTRYYNALASYHEWMGDYEKAIETYERGLSIPGVDRSLISSLMVNKGIAYRMLGKEKTGTEACVDLLKAGIRYNLEGVQAKTIIGNADQLPIALHNLAETYLELAYQLPVSEARIPFLQAAWKHSQEGLDINDRIQSFKKKGQLLVERFLASVGLHTLQVDSGLEQVTQELIEWVAKHERTAGYDVEVVKDLLQRLGGWKGGSMSEANLWLKTTFLKKT